MSNLPIEFASVAHADHHFDNTWIIKSGSHQTTSAIPVEFGGQGGGLSPEDLFLQAAVNCFIGTFKVIAKLSKISFEKIDVVGSLKVDKNDDRKTVMKAIHIEIILSGVDRPERIETIVAKAIKDGFILNSIKSDLTYALNLSEPKILSETV